MKTNTIYLLQSVGFFLQTVNAGLSGIVHNAVISLLLAAFVGAFQLYLSHIGIQAPSPQPQIPKV